MEQSSMGQKVITINPKCTNSKRLLGIKAHGKRKRHFSKGYREKRRAAITSIIERVIKDKQKAKRIIGAIMSNDAYLALPIRVIKAKILENKDKALAFMKENKA